MPLLRFMPLLRLMSFLRLMSIFSCRRKKRDSKSSAPEQGNGTETDCEDSPSAKKFKTNKFGQKCLKNGVVSMRELDLWTKFSSKQHYPKALPFPTQQPTRLVLGSAYTLWTLVMNGKQMPVEKHRQNDLRELIFLSAAPYALAQDQICEVMAYPENERDAWLLGYAKSAQQKLWYILFFPIIAIIVINVIIRLFNSYVMPAILNDHFEQKGVHRKRRSTK